MPTIVDMEFRRRRPERFFIRWDNGVEMLFSPESVLRHALAADVEIEQELFAEIIQENAVCLAKEQLLRYLAVRPHSRNELLLKTARRDHPAPAIEAAMDDLQRAGLIDDEVFARQFARNELEFRPCGRRLLAGKLYQKGIPEPLFQPVLDQLYQENPVAGLISEVSDKFLRRNQRDEPARRKEKLLRHLQSRGFDWDDISLVLPEIESPDG